MYTKKAKERRRCEWCALTVNGRRRPSSVAQQCSPEEKELRRRTTAEEHEEHFADGSRGKWRKERETMGVTANRRPLNRRGT
jgi:hypothetical protein